MAKEDEFEVVSLMSGPMAMTFANQGANGVERKVVIVLTVMNVEMELEPVAPCRLLVKELFQVTDRCCLATDSIKFLPL